MHIHPSPIHYFSPLVYFISTHHIIIVYVTSPFASPPFPTFYPILCSKHYTYIDPFTFAYLLMLKHDLHYHHAPSI